jgi:hypothetical protein
LNNKVPASLKEQIVDDVDHLKVIDTDRDGLSDFDEKYTFNTSPYLYDSFGYGISDKEVVRRALPLCPGAGRSCSGNVSEQDSGIAANGSSSTTILSSLPGTVFGTNETDFVGSPPPDLEKILTDPVALRKLLMQTGKVDQESLNKVTDKDLLLMVSQIMSTTTQATIQNLPAINLTSTTSTR